MSRTLPDSKACVDCGIVKPLSGFYRAPAGALGRSAKCKPCAKAYGRERYHAIKRGEWEPKSGRRDGMTKKEHARADTKLAVRRGDLVPTDECEGCGHDFSEHRRECHHRDYDDPLDVEWLCRPCHVARHSGGPSPIAVEFLRRQGITL